MAKKAVCVGINEYPYRNINLRGCVNDAEAWAELLTTHFDFPRTHIKILTNAQATKKKIISAIKHLVAGAKSGDVLVFTNSSHGSYRPDASGDEDKYDEVICPFDVKENVLVDDELRQLFANIPSGVRLTVIADSCFSGTITRLILPEERRIRFLPPALRGVRELPDTIRARPNRLEKYPESQMKELLITACRDIEHSYDARFGDAYHGALSYCALEAIRAAGYHITYSQLITRINRMLNAARFPQHPQLEGKADHKQQQIFV